MVCLSIVVGNYLLLLYGYVLVLWLPLINTTLATSLVFINDRRNRKYILQYPFKRKTAAPIYKLWYWTQDYWPVRRRRQSSHYMNRRHRSGLVDDKGNRLLNQPRSSQSSHYDAILCVIVKSIRYDEKHMFWRRLVVTRRLLVVVVDVVIIDRCRRRDMSHQVVCKLLWESPNGLPRRLPAWPLFVVALFYYLRK